MILKDKKILIISDYFLPGYKAGGPIKSVNLIVRNLSAYFKFSLITRNHDLGDKKPYFNIKYDEPLKNKNYSIIYLSNTFISILNRNILKINPHIIYLNSFFSTISLKVVFLKKLGIINSKVILSPRGELSEGALSIKHLKKYIFISVCNFFRLYEKIDFHVTSSEEKIRVKKLILCSNIYNIFNFSNSEIPVKKNIIKRPNYLRIVFLSRISLKKNLQFCFKILNNYPFNGNISFDIYGTIEDEKYFSSCVAKAKVTPPNVTVNFLGPVPSINVSNVLLKYHMLFLPTLNENFGHVIVEAMQLGIIPLISDQTPWLNLETSNAGYALDLKNEIGFMHAISKTLIYDNEAFLENSRHVKEYINNKLNNKFLINSYLQMFNS